jgi:small subunit ribosomal protein S13
MAESKTVPSKDFKHIIRIVDTDVDGKKTVEYSLRKIKGVGSRTARAIAQIAGIDPNARMGYLSEDEVERLKKGIEAIEHRLPPWMLNRRKDVYTGENRHTLGSDWIVMVREDVDLMKRIRSYKGVRHELGYKVRGQRTRSTGRGGAVVGVARKKELAKLKEAGKEKAGARAGAKAGAKAEEKKEVAKVEKAA